MDRLSAWLWTGRLYAVSHKIVPLQNGNDMDKDLVTPPRKKLKQARLSFQKLSPGIEVNSPTNIKKRKISEDSAEDIKVVKVIKPNNEKCDTQGKCIDEITDMKETNQKCIISNKDIDIQEMQSKHADIEILENENDLKDLPPDGKKSLISHTSNENDISCNEPSIVSNDSSESDSSVSSDDDNEAVDHNSSGSCPDTSKGDDTSTLNENEVVSGESLHTPKSNLISTERPLKRKLTPKQLLKQEEAAKKREEKEKQKKEKELKRAEEKQEKLKEKLEREEKKRKEREEKEEQKRKEKEEKEKKKQAELEQKSEEKRMKEEEKRKKEEQRVIEKRKKDEKKLAEEEAKKKVAAAFANFFVASKGCSKSIEETKDKIVEHFMPFQVKADMRMAPTSRAKIDENRIETLDAVLNKQITSDLYLKNLKEKSYVPGKSVKTWPLSDVREAANIDEDDDVIPVNSDNEVVESHPIITHPKAKLLLFCENRRPPYWGTWTKKSQHVKPKCPFNKDAKYFDYEVDSDDEWEEEEPGESLHGSDDEKESEDEYEVDNEFFVPHGYLSEEENNEEEETQSPESMKAKLKILELEFEEEMKHKTERIKPRLFGCYWMNQPTNGVGARVLALLSSYRAVFEENMIEVSGPSTPEVSSPVNDNLGTHPSTGSKKKKFPESFVPALIKLVHGNINGRNFLVKEFSSFIKNQISSEEESEQNCENSSEKPVNFRLISKLKISEKIKELASWIACPEEGPFLNRMCWYVPSEIRSAYGLEDLVIPNKVWNYIITPKRELELSNTIPSPSISELNSKSRSVSLITKFTKKISQEERKRQLTFSSSCGDSDVEIVDTVNVSSAVGSTASDDKKRHNVNDTDLEIKSEVSGVKSSSGAADEVKGKHITECSGVRDKLLQFKCKSSSVNSHPEQRKRVPILQSGPLSQAILPSKTNSNMLNDKLNCEKECNSETKTSQDRDCLIVID